LFVMTKTLMEKEAALQLRLKSDSSSVSQLSFCSGSKNPIIAECNLRRSYSRTLDP